MMAGTRYAVFHHCVGRVPTGRGYVVRELDERGVLDARNYGGVEPVSRPYKSRPAAERLAGKLNAG